MSFFGADGITSGKSQEKTTTIILFLYVLSRRLFKLEEIKQTVNKK